MFNEREFTFTQSDFDQIRSLLYTHAGIFLHDGKVEMVYSRVARRLRALEIPSFHEYLQRLHPAAAEWQLFLNALTTNLTSFFREPHHFPLLAEHARWSWMQRHETLKIWSAGCSTGEEPYSLAMTLIDAFASWNPPVRILATDLDTHALETAMRGVYSLDRLERLSKSQSKRFFLQGRGPHVGSVKIRSEISELITFRPFNLQTRTWPMRGPFDAIFCRNVLIYFDKPTQYQILLHFHPRLHQEGLLFVGHSEGLTHAGDLFRPRGKTVYIPTKSR